MPFISPNQHKALTRAREIFEYANAHPTITTWRAKMAEDYGFYDGTQQWTEDALETLRERGQSPITVNKIKNLVNYMSGVEIQTRFRVAFRSHSGDRQEDRLAKALTHVGYFIQEQQDMPHKASHKFRDMLITGIGWSHLYKEGGQIIYDTVNPAHVLFDPDDLSPELTSANFVCRVRWLPVWKAKQLWPKHERYFESLFSSLSIGGFSGELAARRHGNLDLYTSGDGGSGSRVMVVEVQYKRPQVCYTSVDAGGHTFQTFDEDEAESLSNDGEVIEEDAVQIMRVLFTGDLLLEYGPLQPNLPNLPDFTYIPCVWTRRFEDGVPEGWISVMKDLQRESNYRRAKLVNNLSSFRAEIDADAFAGMTLEQIRQELKRPDSVLIKAPGTGLKVESNMPLANGQFEMLQRTDQEIQQVSGIFDDALGKPTNATSGVAIQNRQVNSVRNQVFAFDNLRLMKKREARMLLNLLQGGGETFLHAHLLTPEEEETILLNVVREVGGKKVMMNDIRTLPLSIYVEEVPDFESNLQEQQAALSALLGNANATLIMQSPLFMKRLGIRDYEALAKEMQQLSQKQTQLEQAPLAQTQLEQPPQQSPLETRNGIFESQPLP